MWSNARQTFRQAQPRFVGILRRHERRGKSRSTIGAKIHADLRLENVPHHVPFDVGQAEVATAVVIGEPLVVEA